MGLAGAGRSEEHDVLAGGDEVERAEVRDQVPLQAAGVVEVELLQALAGWEAGGADAALAAVRLAGGDLALQAGDEELQVGPRLGNSAFGESLDAVAQGRCLERSGEVGDLAGQVAGRLGRAGAGSHHATPPSAALSRPSAVS